MVRSFSLPRMSRLALAAITVLVLVAAMLPWSALSAFANTTGNQTIGGFEIDGNFYDGYSNSSTSDSDAPPNDWVNVLSEPTGTDPVGNVDTSNFSTGSKECKSAPANKSDCDVGDWDGGTGTASPKDDISNVYATSALYPDNNGDLFGFFGVQRQATTGTTFYDFELNQSANHTNGNGISVPTRLPNDILIVASQSGNNALDVSATVQKWTTNGALCATGQIVTGDAGGCWTVPAALGSDFVGVSNDSDTANFPGAAGGSPIPARNFMEMAIDLTGAGAVLGCPSTGFTSMNVRSRESISDSAAIKDYVYAPINIPSACGELKILKKQNTANGDALAGATFQIHPNPIPGGTGDLTVTDGGTNDHDGLNNGVVDIDPAVPGSYTVWETVAPAGWIVDPTHYPVTVDPFGSGLLAATVTIVDHQGSITWQKNDAETAAKIAYAGATFAVYGPEATQAAVDASTTVLKTVVDNGANDADNTVGTLKLTGLAAGWYRLHETAAPSGFSIDTTDQDAHITSSDLTANLTSTPFVDPRITSKLVVKKLASDGTTLLDGATFELWQNGTPDTLVDSCVTGLPADPYDGTGECEVSGLAWGHSYYWKETIPPPGYNLPDPVTSGSIQITRENAGTDLGVTTFEDPQTTLTTTATGATIGNSISDSATLGNLNGTVSGSLVFKAYGPFDTDHEGSSVCTPTNLKFTSSPAISVTANGNYGPVSFTPDTAGYYYWVATFTSNNTDNAGKTGVCGAASEISHVTPLQPDLVTTATDAQLPDGTIHDSVTISNTTPSTTGTLTVTVYGPGDTSCATALATYTFTNVHNGTYTTAEYTPTSAGNYRWKAVYVGDANNLDASEPCGSTSNGSSEISHVTKAQPDLVTAATQTAQLPDGTIVDEVTLSGATDDASATLTVSVFGPADATCTTALETWTFNNVGNGVYTTDPAFAPTQAGNYKWYASWAGDDNNEAVDEPCGSTSNGSHEVSHVDKAQPELVTLASDAQLPDGTIADSVTLSGATSDASATLTVSVYAASDASCSTALQTWTQTGFGNGTYTTSPGFAPPAAGDYKWYASWAGDDNNEAVDEPCGSTSNGSHEVSHVSPATPWISTSADESATLVAPQLDPEASVTVQDTATLHGDFHATGTVTFTLYGPTSTNEADCSGDAVGSSTNPVGDGQAVSDGITVTAPGYYWWVASYSGDDNNVETAGQCGDDGEMTHVTQPNVGLQKTADPATGEDGDTIVQPGQQIDYTVAIPNAGDADLTDATVTDTLPPYVVVDESSISDGGVFTAGSDITVSAGTIEWTGVGVVAGGTTNLTYTVHVSNDVPEGQLLRNLAELGSLTSRTTHQVASGDMDLSKSVETLAGDNVGSYTAGDPHNTLVYTLTGSATGTLVQNDVVVTDYIPGYDPSDTTSGKTTYVADSATCSVAGCTASYDAASHLLSWNVGTVTPPATWTMTFRVTIDSPEAAANGAIDAETIDNIGFVESERHVKTPSNKVTTPVTAVLGEKVVRKPPELPFTGSALPLQPAAIVAAFMLGIGVILTSVRRRED